MPVKAPTKQQVDLTSLNAALAPWNGLASGLPVVQAGRPAGALAVAQAAPSLVTHWEEEAARKLREENWRREEEERRRREEERRREEREKRGVIARID
jgi:hypothetical protein